MTDDDLPPALREVEARLGAGLAPGRDLLAAATRPAPPARDLPALVALGADEAQALLEALLGDRDVAAAALEEALTRAAERLEAGDALDLVDLLGLARERGVAAARLLGPKARPDLGPDDRAALLLARGLGLSPDDLARAGGAPRAEAAGFAADIPLATAAADVLARVAARRAAAGRITAVRRPTPADRLRCTYCHGALAPAQARACADCRAPHHLECLQAHGRCAAPGCGGRRVLRPAASPARWRPLVAAAAGLLGAVGLVLVAGRAVSVTPGAPIPDTPPPPVATTEPPPPPPRPSAARLALDDARARAAGPAPDWSAILALLAEVPDDDPALARELEALRAACARERQDEERYQAAVDVVAVRAVDDYPRALELLGQIDPRSRLAADARAYVSWIEADLEVRAAHRDYDAGDAPAALERLDRALGPDVLGPESRGSVRSLRARWQGVHAAFERGRELLEQGREGDAIAELERVVRLEPNGVNAYHRRARELLRRLGAR